MEIYNYKINYTFCVFIFCCIFGNTLFGQIAPVALPISNDIIDAPGDIAFVAWNDTPDGFAFVLLDNCPANTQITFTDEEWNGTNFISQTSEGNVRWTNNTGSTITKGTVIYVENANGGPTANHGSAVESDFGVNFNDAGDQWYAFTGTGRSAPGTFLAFYGPLTNGATLDGTGLEEGTTAIIRDGDYAYVGPTICNGDNTTCAQMIYDPVNWQLIDEASPPIAFPGDVPSEFTGSLFSECVINSIIAGNNQTACNGSTNTFSQDLIIYYADAPSSGTLDVNGESFPITASPQTVTLSNLNATGALLNITANFSDNPTCTRTAIGIISSPSPCCLNIHLSAVNPTTGDITIKNCGNCSIDLSDYRLTSELSATGGLSSLTLVSGNLVLTSGSELTVNWPGLAPNNDGGADLGLYLPNGNFGSQFEIIDFVQWGSSGNGREAVANTAGLWTAGNYINSSEIPPYVYSDATCSNNGLSFWTTTGVITSGITNVCTPTSSVNSTGSGEWQHLMYNSTLVASINDNGNVMGVVNGEFYLHSGTVRSDGNQKYLDRSIYIRPATQPSTPVSVRFYFTNEELNKIIFADPSLIGREGLHISKFSNSICADAYNGNNGVLISSADITTSDFGNGHVLEFDVNSFSGFFPGTNANLLPIELLNFAGIHHKNQVLLSWQTESEQNNDFFILERSYDANIFQKIGIIKGAGTSNTRHSYQFTDDFYEQKEIVYYRLRQVDLDDTETVSNMIAITLDIDNVGAVMAPNMATKLTTIIFNEALEDETMYEVFNISGQLFEKGNCEIGTHKVDLNIENYTAGNYFVKFTNSTKYYFAKFIKIRD